MTDTLPISWWVNLLTSFVIWPRTRRCLPRCALTHKCDYGSCCFKLNARILFLSFRDLIENYYKFLKANPQEFALSFEGQFCLQVEMQFSPNSSHFICLELLVKERVHALYRHCHENNRSDSGFDQQILLCCLD